MDGYEKGNLPHSSTPEAKFVVELRESVGVFEAPIALSMLLKQINKTSKQRIDMTDLQVWRGIVNLVMFMEGISNRAVTAHRNSLKQLANKYNERLSDDSAATDGLKARLDALVSDHQEIRDRGRDDMAQAVKLAREQANQQRTNLSQELEEFKSFYSAGLALREPVAYWRTKCSKHWKYMWTLFVCFILYVLVVVCLSWTWLPETGLVDPTFWKDAGLELVGLTLAVLGVVVAGARMLYKLATSQLHLHNDADERVTMVQAYLALREGGHADESHMGIVLERLFAPVSDGVVKDDLIVTPSDLIKAALTRK